MQALVKIFITALIMGFTQGNLFSQDNIKVEEITVQADKKLHVYVKDSTGNVISIIGDKPRGQAFVKLFKDGNILYVQGEDGSIVKVGREGVFVVGPSIKSQVIAKGDSLLMQEEIYMDTTQITWGLPPKDEGDTLSIKKKKVKRFSTRLHLEFGWNNLLGQEGLGLPLAYDSTMNQIHGKSNHTAIYLFSKYYLNKEKKFAVGIGAGFDFNKYKFAGDYVFGKDSSEVYVTAYGDPDYQITKNKFKTTTFIVPVMLEINFSKKTGISLGGYGGIVIAQLHKLHSFKFLEKRKIYGNYKVNPVRYGTKLVLHIGSINFYVNYDLNSYFVEGASPYALNQFSGGFLIRI